MQVRRYRILGGFRVCRVLVRFATTIAIATAVGTAFGQPKLNELQITAPADGSTAALGQTLDVAVQVARGVSFPDGVGIVISDSLGGAGPVTAPPFTFSLPIPANASPGAYRLTAIGLDSKGALAASQPVTVHIEPATAPVQISVQPTQVLLPALGATMSLRVVATFADNSTANVTESTNMFYTSADPTVATADTSGAVSAVGAGSTSLDVKYASGGGSLEVVVPVTVLPPIILTAPSTLAFSFVTVGSSSVAQTASVTNSANFPISFLGVSATGDFGETDDCVSGSPIAPNNSCSVHVTFSPTLGGPRAGSISLVNNAQVVATNLGLSGIGIVPVTLKISPKVLNFGGETVNSQSKPRKVTLSNPKGNKKHPGLPVLVEGLGELSQFHAINDCPQTLVAGKACKIAVTFDPTTPGPHAEMLMIRDDAGAAPQIVNLKGVGK
jgi:hypothetical protein